MNNIKKLRQEYHDITIRNRGLAANVAAERRDFTPEESAEFEANSRTLKDLEPAISRCEQQMEQERRLGAAALARPGTPTQWDGHGSGYASPSQFESFGHYLQLVREAGRPGGMIDQRLYSLGTGGNEQIPSEGGFLVQYDYAAGLLQKIYSVGKILSRITHIPISANANGLKINAIAETSRATGSRYGGVQIYRAEEAGAGTASTPKLARLEFNLKKIIALYYATDELVQDSVALESFINIAIPQEFSFVIENEIIRGIGGGQMLGILKSACKVSVAKEAGQTAATIVYENVTKMFSRLPAASQQTACWLVNVDALPQLFTMGITLGMGGAPVFLPAGGASGSPFNTLFGCPIIPVEYCETIGTEGDIILADLSQYYMIEKGGLQTASSMHVQFLTDQMVFRFVYRNDGMPAWLAPLTPFKGTATVSPFVTLAVRA